MSITWQDLVGMNYSYWCGKGKGKGKYFYRGTQFSISDSLSLMLSDYKHPNNRKQIIQMKLNMNENPMTSGVLGLIEEQVRSKQMRLDPSGDQSGTRLAWSGTRTGSCSCHK